jgi:hypothetical protein
VLCATNGRGYCHDWGYLGAFLTAALASAYVMYGFDTASSLGEETLDPRRTAPKAIIRAVVASFILGGLILLFAILSVSDINSPDIRGFMNRSLGRSFLILRNYLVFKHSARFIVDGMSNVLISPIFALLTWHGYKITRWPADNFQIANDEAVIKGDGHISLKLIFVNRKHPNLRHFHTDPLFKALAYRPRLASAG